jgi:hypothetical protein
MHLAALVLSDNGGDLVQTVLSVVLVPLPCRHVFYMRPVDEQKQMYAVLAPVINLDGLDLYQYHKKKSQDPNPDSPTQIQFIIVT